MEEELLDSLTNCKRCGSNRLFLATYLKHFDENDNPTIINKTKMCKDCNCVRWETKDVFSYKYATGDKRDKTDISGWATNHNTTK